MFQRALRGYNIDANWFVSLEIKESEENKEKKEESEREVKGRPLNKDISRGVRVGNEAIV